MTNAELIKALRCDKEDYGDCNAEKPCEYQRGASVNYCDYRRLLRDAADAIERLTAEIERKDKALQEWAKTWEQREDNAIRHICDHCDTPIEVRLKEGACEDCPIKIVVKEIFDEQPS
jgi:DNA-directed RNA polymerase subunit RPC12/RpoP